jgi:hypothetical protein
MRQTNLGNLNGRGMAFENENALTPQPVQRANTIMGAPSSFGSQQNES